MMRKGFLALVFALLPLSVSAQVTTADQWQGVTPPIFGNPSAVNGGGSFPVQLLAPVTPTDCSVAQYGFQGDVHTGLGYRSDGSVNLCANGGMAGFWTPSGVIVNYASGYKLGVGTSSPTWALHVVGTDGNTLAAVRRFGGLAQFVMERWGGTIAVPVAFTSSGGQVGEIGAYALTDTVAGQQNTAHVRFHLDGTGTATSSPGDMQVWTTPVGATTAISRFRIAQDGRIAQGNYTAAYGAGAITESVRLGPMTDGSPTHVALVQTTVPTCSSNCGTSPAIMGSDSAMTITMGSSGVPASGWVVTFNAAWAAAPACVVSMGKTGMVVGKLPLTVVTTTTTMTVVTNGTAPATTDVYHAQCFGVQ